MVMGFLDYFRTTRRSTANQAKERLQIIIARDRGGSRSTLDYLPDLQREVLEVVRKYVSIDQDQVKINIEKEDDYEVLELNILLPDEK
jgi:cell division topological specificity factor